MERSSRTWALQLPMWASYFQKRTWASHSRKLATVHWSLRPPGDNPINQNISVMFGGGRRNVTGAVLPVQWGPPMPLMSLMEPQGSMQNVLAKPSPRTGGPGGTRSPPDPDHTPSCRQAHGILAKSLQRRRVPTGRRIRCAQEHFIPSTVSNVLAKPLPRTREPGGTRSPTDPDHTRGCRQAHGILAKSWRRRRVPAGRTIC